MLDCRTCGSRYESRFLKLRFQLFAYTYERCEVCSERSFHRVANRTVAIIAWVILVLIIIVCVGVLLTLIR